jgi:hypothetical protein
MPHTPRLEVPSLRDAEAAGNTSDVDMDQHLLSESAGGDSLHDDPLPDVPQPDVPHPEACPEASVGKEDISPCVAEVAMVLTFLLGSSSCLVRFVSANRCIPIIDYDTHRKVFGSQKVYFIHTITGYCACRVIAPPGM